MTYSGQMNVTGPMTFNGPMNANGPMAYNAPIAINETIDLSEPIVKEMAPDTFVQDSIEIIVGDLEQLVAGSDNLNSCREELEALVKDLRYVLSDEELEEIEELDELDELDELEDLDEVD